MDGIRACMEPVPAHRMPMAPPLIHFGDLPPDGRNYSGEIRTDLFALTGKYDPVFVPPLIYDVQVRLEEGDVIVEGKVEARFLLQCGRCAARLPWQVSLDPYFTCEAPEGDTLLSLPGYPRCEESNVEPQPCQKEGAFAPESEFVPLSGEEPLDAPRKDVWDVLDLLPPPPTPPSSP
jgi:uncharacterized protein